MAKARYILFVSGEVSLPLALFKKLADYIDQSFDKVQNCGNQNEDFEGLVLVAVFLFPCHCLSPFRGGLYLLLTFIIIHKKYNNVNSADKKD